MKKDIYNNEQRFNNWLATSKNEDIGLSKKNSELILQYVEDMQQGKNTSGSRKGCRSLSRLNSLRLKVCWIARELEKRKIQDLTKTTKDDIHKLFHNMESGLLKKGNGKNYASVVDYIKAFKACWHWYMKINRLSKKPRMIEDITIDLSISKKEDPPFVYFTKEDLNKMLPYFTDDEQVRMLFMFDTIIRSGIELANIKVSDLTSDYKELTIRQETSKTYGRTIKILICSDALKKYISRNNLKDEDFLFQFSAPYFNRKLQIVAKQVFSDKMTKGGAKYSEITAYDFRHSGAINWRLTAYKTKIDALMYRGGWSDLAMLNYYTKKIGMKDTIEEGDLLTEEDKTKLEEEIETLKAGQKDLLKFKTEIMELVKPFRPVIMHAKVKK